jgi:dynein light intermediate chain
MTIQAYQTLYESSIAFGMRKTLQAEQRRAEMDASIKTLTHDCEDLQNEVDELEAEIKEIEEKEKARQENDELAHKEEVEFKKKANAHLKEQLEGLLAAPKR